MCPVKARTKASWKPQAGRIREQGQPAAVEGFVEIASDVRMAAIVLVQQELDSVDGGCRQQKEVGLALGKPSDAGPQQPVTLEQGSLLLRVEIGDHAELHRVADDHSSLPPEQQRHGRRDVRHAGLVKHHIVEQSGFEWDAAAGCQSRYRPERHMFQNKLAAVRIDALLPDDPGVAGDGRQGSPILGRHGIQTVKQGAR